MVETGCQRNELAELKLIRGKLSTNLNNILDKTNVFILTNTSDTSRILDLVKSIAILTDKIMLLESK